MSEKRDPLKQEPLPRPGDSVEGELYRVFTESVLMWVFVVALLVCVVGLQWYTWWLQKPIHPAPFTVIAAIVIVFAAFKWRKSWRQVRNLRLGHRGEVAVGQRLEELRAMGYRVYHDIRERGYNIDHVLIGPGGVFVIETKTISMPVGRKPVVSCKGERLLVDGRELDRDPLRQVRAGADEIAGVLERVTGERVRRRGVVLFPDWWIDGRPAGLDVWVLNPKALGGFLKQEPEALEPEQVDLLASALEGHVRSTSRD